MITLGLDPHPASHTVVALDESGVSLGHLTVPNTAEGSCIVRLKREEGKQNVGFSSRPFLLCGLPVRKPREGEMLYERRNGNFVLQITGHPDYGLPFGQDRVVPITWRRSLCGSRVRPFAFSARFNFFNEAQIWYSRVPERYPVSDEFENVIVLSDEFYREIAAHPIPADLEAVKVLAGSPAVLDLFMWLSYRCVLAKAKESIPLFGTYGLANQIGSIGYARPQRFREKLEGWLNSIRVLWPECPARISADGSRLTIDQGSAVLIEEQGGR